MRHLVGHRVDDVMVEIGGEDPRIVSDDPPTQAELPSKLPRASTGEIEPNLDRRHGTADDRAAPITIIERRFQHPPPLVRIEGQRARRLRLSLGNRRQLSKRRHRLYHA